MYEIWVINDVIDKVFQEGGRKGDSVCIYLEMTGEVETSGIKTSFNNEKEIIAVCISVSLDYNKLVIIFISVSVGL